MRVIGIDPGLALAGYGIVEGDAGQMKQVTYGVIATPSGVGLPQRLRLLYDGLSAVLHEWQPAEIAVEELFFRRNVTTAISVGQARGVLLLAAEQQGLPYFSYTPAQVKQAVSGNGKAEKAQMQQMVKLLLALGTIPQPDDAADALAIAICHLQHGGIRRAIS